MYDQKTNLRIEGCTNSFFSVSPTQKVYFSTGNLQYNITQKSWRFAENQWDSVGHIIGRYSGRKLPSYNGWMDLFFGEQEIIQNIVAKRKLLLTGGTIKSSMGETKRTCGELWMKTNGCISLKNVNNIRNALCQNMSEQSERNGFISR